MKITLFALFAGLLMLGGCAEESELESTRMSAEQGDADAQSNLGTNYYYGTGVPQDYKEAAKWYRKSAEQGHAMAQNHLGFMYSNGEGVPQDDKEAVKWYRKSAEQGDADAQSNLGYMYYIGTGVIEDYVTAYAWVSVAKANGNAKSVKALDILTKKMTKEQIVQAKSLATEIQKRIEANRKD
jgi:TPR repeat protein